MQCNICSQNFDSIDSLRRHSSRIHKISSSELYNEIILKGIVPTCKCGCGINTKFISFEKGYNDWIKGHIARVENNWGHNQTAIQNSTKTRKEQYKNGERHVWNVGLTKETNISLQLAGNKISKTYTRSKKNEYAIRMKTMRLDGTIPTKYGKESANWKGGTSSISNIIRSNKRLYTEWVYPILKEQSFKCKQCNSNKNLEVHHSIDSMSSIIQKFVDKNIEYTFDEKRKIMNDVIDYHIKNKVAGDVLCKECHKKIHPSYNY